MNFRKALPKENQYECMLCVNNTLPALSGVEVLGAQLALSAAVSSSASSSAVGYKEYVG